jgi:hypothetical protein
MYDQQIREAFHYKILKEAHAAADTLVIDELGIKNGSYRADIAVLNGKLEGYEIKGEHDSLVRLPDQVEAYNAIFARASLITCERFLETCKGIVPSWWGIYLAKPSSTGDIIFKKIQLPKVNQKVDSYSLARLLWRDEAIELASTFIDRKVLNKCRRHDVYKILADKLNSKEMAKSVLIILKKRTSWRQGQ